MESGKGGIAKKACLGPKNRDMFDSCFVFLFGHQKVAETYLCGYTQHM